MMAEPARENGKARLWRLRLGRLRAMLLLDGGVCTLCGHTSAGAAHGKGACACCGQLSGKA